MLQELLWKYVQAHPWLTASSFVFMAYAPINNVLLPHLYGKLVGAIEKKHADMQYYFVAIILVFVGVHVLSMLYDVHDSYMNPAFQKFMRTELTDKVIDLHDENFEESATGDTISRFVKIPEIVLEWFNRLKEVLIPFGITVTLVASYFFRHDVWLAVGLLTCVSLVCLNLYLTPQACMKESLDMNNAYAHVYEEFDELMRNMLSIFSADKKDDELERMQADEGVFAAAYRKLTMCGIGRKLVSFTVVISYCIFFMYRCYTLLKAGRMDTTAFVALFMMFTSTLGSMWWFVGIIQRGLKETGMLKSTSDSLSPIKTKATATQSSTPGAASHSASPPEGVGLDNVTFMYSTATTPTLRNFSLQVRPGEHVVITGENGSGKSTILKLLLRLVRPTSGDAYVNGQWYSQMTTQEVRRNFGYVPQNSVLFNRSVMDNIRYGNEEKVSEDEVARWVDSLGLTPEFAHLEGGVRGSAGKNGSNLSGGQRQLVMALRLLLRGPSVLVMDEPTASLDADTKQLLMRMIDAMADKSTLIMVSHDPYILNHISKHIKMLTR